MNIKLFTNLFYFKSYTIHHLCPNLLFQAINQIKITVVLLGFAV